MIKELSLTIISPSPLIFSHLMDSLGSSFEASRAFIFFPVSLTVLEFSGSQSVVLEPAAAPGSLFSSVQPLSRVRLFSTPPAPLSMGFPKQEYWSGLPFSSPGDLPDSGTEPRSPALQADTLPSEPPGKSLEMCWVLTVENLENIDKCERSNPKQKLLCNSLRGKHYFNILTFFSY